jgi:hypothetical protein
MNIIQKIVIIILFVALSFFIYRISVTALISLHSFLSFTRPIETKTLVVEGWLFTFDYMMDAVVQEIQKGQYSCIVTTGRSSGFQTTTGRPEIKSFAESCKRALCERGIDPAIVFAVPAPDHNYNKTYKSACAVKTWLIQNKIDSVNVFTGGTHGRKTYLIYRKTLSPEIQVGIISCKIEHYDPVYWWRSYRGIKSTTKFLFGYLYALVWRF